jgi:DNA-binding beta-propeller fold protein YncE
MKERTTQRWCVIGAVVSCLFGCNFGQSGIEPPHDRLFFPAGLLPDTPSDWLFVVNANSDLRYNGGTVAAVDLRKVAEDRGKAWDMCPLNVKPWREPFAGRRCCRDRLDSRVLNCDERAYIDPSTTVRIGSFGAAIVQQRFERATDVGIETVRRLFVAVRSDPSVSFIDAHVDAANDRMVLRCSGPRGGREGTSGPCERDWRIEDAGAGMTDSLLPEEPFALALDPTLGVLWVGHLFGGLSSIDVCAPGTGAVPTLAETLPIAVPGSTAGQGVTSLTLVEPGDSQAPILATSRFSTDVSELVLRSAGAVSCDPSGTSPAEARDLTLVPRAGFASAAFYPFGRDIRGVLLSADRQKAFVLHRNDLRRENPSALAVVDRRPDPLLRYPNRPVDVVEVCQGPTEMKRHDAGRGPLLFVTCFDAGQVYVVDPDVLAVVAVIDVGRGPNTTVFPSDEPTIAYVSGFAENAVAVIDLRPGSPTEYRVVQRIGFPHLATQ